MHKNVTILIIKIKVQLLRAGSMFHGAACPLNSDCESGQSRLGSGYDLSKIRTQLKKRTQIKTQGFAVTFQHCLIKRQNILNNTLNFFYI